MTTSTCPPCNHNCRQGRDCPARKKTLPAPTDLAAALLADVPIRGRLRADETGLHELVFKRDVLAALSAHLDPALTERAGEVLEGVTPGPWEAFIDDSGGRWTGWPLSIEAVSITDKTVVRTGGQWPYEWDAKTSQEEAVSNARFIAWCREGVPALLAQNAALRAERDAAEQRGYANAMEAERKLHEDRIEALEAKLAKAGGLLEAWVELSEHCSIEEGVCCCGESMNGHSNPMDCGHTPLDHGAYIAVQLGEKTRAALTAALDPALAERAGGVVEDVTQPITLQRIGTGLYETQSDYRLAPHLQSIVEAAKTAPQWDTVNDRMAPLPDTPDPSAHVNETPKREHDAGNVLTDAAEAERDALRAERDRYLRHLTAGAESLNAYKDRAEAAEAEVEKLRGALSKLHHAVCGETGFAACVRLDSGKAYPWPALDEADATARAALPPAKQDNVADSNARGVGVPESVIRQAVLEWIKKDTGTAVKMSVTLGQVNALTARVMAVLEPTTAQPHPDDAAVDRFAAALAALKGDDHE